MIPGVDFGKWSKGKCEFCDFNDMVFNVKDFKVKKYEKTPRP